MSDDEKQDLVYVKMRANFGPPYELLSDEENKKINDLRKLEQPSMPQGSTLTPGVTSGMTLRDYFAGQAVLMFDADVFVDEVARRCYLLADAMLDQRDKGESNP